jgi:hypothetical protein
VRCEGAKGAPVAYYTFCRASWTSGEFPSEREKEREREGEADREIRTHTSLIHFLGEQRSLQTSLELYNVNLRARVY